MSAYALNRAATMRETLHQAAISARQEMRLKFFRLREAAAWRQMRSPRAWCVKENIGAKGIVEAVRVQQNRNHRLGIA